MKVLKLDLKRSISEIMKREFGCENFIVVAMINEEIHSYIPVATIGDADLVYMIQCLQDRRDRLFKEEN